MRRIPRIGCTPLNSCLKSWIAVFGALVLIVHPGGFRRADAAEPTWTPLPTSLNLPDGTGAPLPLPTLSADGPPLVLSNSPEQITSPHAAVALCRARPAAGRFRVFFHHQNATGHALQIGLAVTNVGAAPVELYVARNSQSLPAAVATPDASPAAAGRRALAAWFASRHGLDDAPGQDQYLATLPPGGARLITQAVAGRAEGGETLTGMYDLAVRFADASRRDAPAVEVTTLAYRGAPPSPQALATLKLEPPDPPALLRCRGLFAHGTRRGSLTVTVADGTPRWLDLGGPASGPYDHSPPGEYEDAALDPRDPAAFHSDGGNYGVLYDLDVAVVNPQPRPMRVRCLLNAAGGDGASALLVDEAAGSCPPVLRAFDSWAFQDLALGAGATRHFRLRFSLPGGSPGAQRLFFWPQPGPGGGPDQDAGNAPTPAVTRPPPVVSVVSPLNDSEVSETVVPFRYSLRTPSGQPVTGVRVLVDGAPVQADRDLRLVAADTSTGAGTTRQISVPVPAHDCTVSLIAESQAGDSPPAQVSLRWAAPAAPERFVIRPRLYVLAVGVSRYRDASLALTYPDQDARGFAAAMLTQKGRLYADVQERVLTDGQATRSAIADGLDWIQRQTTQHDVAMVFLAGHGANDSQGDYLFIPADFDRDHVKSTGLPFTDIRRAVEGLAGKTLVFVDTCHSGNVMGTAQGRSMDVAGAVEELSGAENGAVVFTASTGRQVALEDPAWGHGAFTKALIEGLSGRAAYDHDGRVTVDMLDLYLSDRVKELTRGAQTPTTAKPQTVPDFPVALSET